MIKRDIEFRKKLYIIYAVLGGLLYILFIGLKLVGQNVASDILYKDTLLPLLVGMIHDITELVVLALSYAVVIFSLYKFSVCGTIGAFIIYGVLTLIKYFLGSGPMLNLMSGGGIGLDDLAYSAVFEVSVPFILECLQYFVVVLLSAKLISKREKASRIANSISTRDAKDQSRPIYPFTRLFDKHNPILCSTLFCGIIVAVTSLLLTVERCMYYVVSQALYFGWKYTISTIMGMEMIADIPYMMNYFISDIFRGVICYFAVILLEMIFFDVYFKRKASD